MTMTETRFRLAPWWWPFGRAVRSGRESWERCGAVALNTCVPEEPHTCVLPATHRADGTHEHRCRDGFAW